MKLTWKVVNNVRMSDRVDVRPLYYWLVAPDVLSQKHLLYKIYWGDEIFSIIDVSIRLCWYLPRKRAAVKRLETGFNSHAIKLLRSDPRKPGGLVFSALNPSWTFYIYISSSRTEKTELQPQAIMGYFMMGYLNRMLCTLIMYPNYAIPRRKPSGLTEQRDGDSEEWRQNKENKRNSLSCLHMSLVSSWQDISSASLEFFSWTTLGVLSCDLWVTKCLTLMVHPSLFEHDSGNVSILTTAILIFLSSQGIWLFSQQSIWSRDYLPAPARSRLEVDIKSWTFPNDPRVGYNLQSPLLFTKEQFCFTK